MVLVAVQLSVLGLYLPPVYKTMPRSPSAPDNHFTAGPDCGVNSIRPCGRVGGACRGPAIRAGIISPASIEIGFAVQLRPKQSFHFRSKLPCGVSAIRRVNRAAGSPRIICAWSVPRVGNSGEECRHPCPNVVTTDRYGVVGLRGVKLPGLLFRRHIGD